MALRSLACAALLLAGAAACQTGIPKDALRFDAVTMERRQMQTRRYETTDEKQLLAASAALLQDLGFNLDESETELGVIVASKDRDAKDTGQVMGAIFLAALGNTEPVWDEKQKLRACIVTRPIGEAGDNVAVRVTFQRIVWNNKQAISKLEGLYDPEQYQEFFEKLSKSVFLEAHSL